MIGYVKNTYILFNKCSRKYIKEFLYEKYHNKTNPSNRKLYVKYPAPNLFNKIYSTNLVVLMVFDPYNIYEPIKKHTIDEGELVDWTQEELDYMINEKLR